MSILQHSEGLGIKQSNLKNTLTSHKMRKKHKGRQKCIKCFDNYIKYLIKLSENVLPILPCQKLNSTSIIVEMKKLPKPIGGRKNSTN